MKKEVMLAVFILFFLLVLISKASAEYACSNNTEISKDTEEIRELERKSVNGLGIALINAEEHSVLKRITAELILEAEQISLTNETKEKEAVFSDGTYIIKMINATSESARIRINGNEKEINEEEYATLGGLEIILREAEEFSGGSIEFIAGNKKTILSNDENPSESLTISSISYLIEILSATDTEATITAWKCKNSEVLSLEEIEENNAIEEENANQALQINDTKRIMNQTSDNKSMEKAEGEKADIEESIFKKIWFWFSLAIIIIMLGYVIYKKTI